MRNLSIHSGAEFPFYQDEFAEVVLEMNQPEALQSDEKCGVMEAFYQLTSIVWRLPSGHGGLSCGGLPWKAPPSVLHQLHPWELLQQHVVRAKLQLFNIYFVHLPIQITQGRTVTILPDLGNNNFPSKRSASVNGVESVPAAKAGQRGRDLFMAGCLQAMKDLYAGAILYNHRYLLRYLRARGRDCTSTRAVFTPEPTGHS